MTTAVKIDHHEAFRRYCAMGHERGLRALAEQSGVSFRAVAEWSKKHDWKARSVEFDAQVAAEALAETKDSAVSERATYAKKLFAVSDETLDKVREMLAAVDLTKVTGADLKAVVSAAVELVKQSEMMSGVVPDPGDAPSAAPGVPSEAWSQLTKTIEGIAGRVEQAAATGAAQGMTEH